MTVGSANNLRLVIDSDHSVRRIFLPPEVHRTFFSHNCVEHSMADEQVHDLRSQPLMSVHTVSEKNEREMRKK
jgi:hypothetical protein